MTHDRAAIESVAKILLINSEGKILALTLGKHLMYPEKSFLPDLPGGIVDPGESELLAAVRETKEECGIDVDVSGVQLVYANTEYIESSNKSVARLLYVAPVSGLPEVTLSWEHSDYAWVSVEELASIDFRPSFNAAIQYALTHKLI